METQDDSRKLFLGGLRYTETEDSLKEHFEQFGEVELVEIPKERGSGRPRGFGFITFKDSDVALQLSESTSHVFNGRVLDIKLAKPRFSSYPGKHYEAAEGAGIQDEEKDLEDESFLPNRIFVGGLPDGVTNAVLRDYFSKFGDVLDTFVLLHAATKRPRGFGFVSFKDESVVPKVLAFQKHTILGKRVESRLATKRSEKKPVVQQPQWQRPMMGQVQAQTQMQYFMSQNSQVPPFQMFPMQHMSTMQYYQLMANQQRMQQMKQVYQQAGGMMHQFHPQAQMNQYYAAQSINMQQNMKQPDESQKDVSIPQETPEGQNSTYFDRQVQQ